MPYSAEHKEGTRQRIVTSAARLFNRKGFAEVTVSEIMTAAGLTHGGFYRHFRSKDELYSEVISQFLCRPAEPWQQKPAERCVPGQPFALRCRCLSVSRASRRRGRLVPADRAPIGCRARRRSRQDRLSPGDRVDDTAVRGQSFRAGSARAGPRLCGTLCRRHGPGARHRR